MAHLGIQYTDLGLHLVVLSGAQLRPIQLPIGEQALFDRYGRIARPELGQDAVELGVAFPGFFTMIGDTERGNVNEVVRQILDAARVVVEKKLGSQLGKAVIAVPHALMSLRRAALVSSAQAAGLNDVELVDAATPCAVVYSSSVKDPATLLVYSIGYGECECALLRFARGRVKVLDSGIVERASGQLFDVHLMEALVLALREQNVFLGLKGFRPEQWVEFRRIAALARAELSTRDSAQLALPPSIAGDGMAIQFTLSAAGLAGKLAPAFKLTLDEVEALLERNEIKPSEIDAVIAIGDKATRYPGAALLAQTFPGKVMIGNARTVAAAAAAYSGWLVDGSADARHPLTTYFSAFDPDAKPAAVGSESDAPPVVTAVSITPIDGAPEAPTAAAVEMNADAQDGASGAPATTVATAKDLIERGRHLIEVASQMLHELDGKAPLAEAEDESAEAGPADVLIAQAESLLARGLHLEAVSLAHRAYAEANFNGRIFAAMLRIHVEAAMALDQADGYEDSIRLLMCAHSHDRTDQSVHRALAARHLKHAQAMLDSDSKAAFAAVMDALRFDPKHADALSLFDRLSGAPNKPQ